MMNLRSSRTFVAGLVVVTGLLGACGATPGSGAPAGGAAVSVVTTTTVFADIVRNVGGDRVDAVSIIPPGVGPEDYEPKPDDARRLADADLIVSNGVGLDDFLDDLLASGSSGSATRLVLGDGIEAIEDDGGPNPHFWLDPSIVRDHFVPAIAGRLSALDPAGKTDYEAGAASYRAALDRLDQELQAKVDEIPPAKRKLVTSHDAFPYFARHYGFELVGVIVDSVGQEPTASELAALVETVKAADVTAIFSEAQFNPELSRTLAEEAGITDVVSTLYTDALGPAPADTFLGMMRWNVEQIVAVLR